MNTAWLQTISGQARLFAATFGVAAAIGVGVATQRAYFEGLIQEKYVAVSGATQAMAAKIESGDPSGADLQNTPELKAELYAEWMTRADARADSRAPAVMMRMDPAFFRRRVEMTLAGGTASQRARALLFVRGSGAAQFRESLDRAIVRARAAGDAQFEQQARAIQVELSETRNPN